VWYRPTTQTEIVKIKHEIAPGGNKATLTLADGSVITLDSAANGVLAQQGSTRVTKLANGELVYHTDESGEHLLQYNTMTTPRGGQYKLVLPDGSLVWLNAASSISYPTAFTGTDRTVTINGEAYFEIARNEQMPFHVKVNKMMIEVLGTHFNVMAYDDEPFIRTSLLKGAVKVNGILLKVGQQSQLDRKGSLKLIGDADMEEAIAWKNGLFEFNHEPLVSIIRKLNRWYDVDIKYADNIVNKTFTGQISRNANISTVLKTLEITQGVHFKIEENIITVMP
jgi:ferric-dicitrate binding protein FerR (iron transport regulator)